MSHTEGMVTVEVDTHAPDDLVGTYGAMLRVDFNEAPGPVTAGRIEKIVAGVLNLAILARKIGMVDDVEPDPPDFEYTGIGLITRERLRQIEEEDFTPEHDAEHTGGELAQAAACYTWPNWSQGARKPPQGWPFEDSAWRSGNGHEGGRVRDLVKAGALIAAEIDRLQRAGR